VAGQVDGTGAIVAADRYDGWGEIVAAAGSGVAHGWKFQGALDVGAGGDPLYDIGARFYSPAAGAWTQQDTLTGSVLDPISLNRFLYAHANPATLIDPTGRIAIYGDDICQACTSWNGPSGQVATREPWVPYVRRYQAVPTHALERDYTPSPGQAPAGGGGALTLSHGGASGSVPTQGATGVLAQWLLEQGINPITGCTLGDIACGVGQEIERTRVAIAILITLIPIGGDIYQAITVNHGHDPIGDVHFSQRDKEVAGILALQSGGLLFSPAYTRRLTSGGATSISRWQQSTFRGTKIFLRNDLVDPARLDSNGVSNLQRMSRGWAPVGPDGFPINLHHVLQTPDGPIIELAQSFHVRYRRVIHVNPPTMPSGIDRYAFDRWRESYWKWRAEGFGQ
jgi:RHS repeat-associated protein